MEFLLANPSTNLLTPLPPARSFPSLLFLSFFRSLLEVKLYETIPTHRYVYWMLFQSQRSRSFFSAQILIHGRNKERSARGNTRNDFSHFKAGASCWLTAGCCKLRCCLQRIWRTSGNYRRLLERAWIFIANIFNGNITLTYQ